MGYDGLSRYDVGGLAYAGYGVGRLYWFCCGHLVLANTGLLLLEVAGSEFGGV